MRSRKTIRLPGGKEVKTSMNCGLLLFVFFIVTMAGASALGQNPFPTIPVTLTIVPSAAVTSDNGTAYVDGKSGVSAEILDYGNQERNLNVTLGKRYFNLKLTSGQLLASHPPFPQASPGLPTPSFVPTTSAFQGIGLSIHHIMYLYHDTCNGDDCGQYPQGTPYQNMDYSFTTRGLFDLKSPDRFAMEVKFASNYEEAMASLGLTPPASQNNNYPYNTSPIKVSHFAATPTSVEWWEVEPVTDFMGLNPDNPGCDPGYNPYSSITSASCASNVATLLRSSKNSGLTNSGQFLLPFKLLITRK
jgi:hypothetical protein